jgi:hypothetical protein
MAEEEKGHPHMLLELYEQRFWPNLPPIRREDVKGFLRRRPIWLTRNVWLDTIRKEAEIMELEAKCISPLTIRRRLSYRRRAA